MLPKGRPVSYRGGLFSCLNKIKIGYLPPFTTMKKLLICSLIGLSTLALSAQKNKDQNKEKKSQNRDSMMREAMKNYRYPGMMGAKCSALPVYKFQGNLVVVTTSGKPGKDSSHTKIKYFINDSFSYAAYTVLETDKKKDDRSGTMTGILNFKDSTTVTLTERDGKKMGMCMSMKKKDLPPFMRNNKHKDSTENYFKGMAKTGRTKMICGYLCEEYKKDDAKETRTMWITKDESLWVGKLRRSVAAHGNNADDMPADMRGMMMEMTNLKKSDNAWFKWEVVEVNKNAPSQISTAEYEFR